MTDETTQTTDTTTTDTTTVADPLDAKTALGGATDGDATGDDVGKVDADADKTDDKADAADKTDDQAAEPVKYALKAPEGYAGLDDAALEAATPLLNKLGVKAEDAQGIVDEFAKEVMPKMAERAQAIAQERQLEQIVGIRKEWDDARVADKEVGGADALAKLSVCAKAIDVFGTPELRKLFDETGIGNHPEVVRAFYRVGLQVQEGAFHRSDVSEQRKKSDGELFYGDTYQKKDAA